jgi:hypothetical protein
MEGLTLPEDLEPDPLLTPFYTAELTHRERLRFLVSLLDDEEIEKVQGLFAHHNLKQVPYEFWTVAARVRAYCRRELKRRKAEESIPA